MIGCFEFQVHRCQKSRLDDYPGVLLCSCQATPCTVCTACASESSGSMSLPDLVSNSGEALQSIEAVGRKCNPSRASIWLVASRHRLNTAHQFLADQGKHVLCMQQSSIAVILRKGTVRSTSYSSLSRKA
jgi:hypothetical protein